MADRQEKKYKSKSLMGYIQDKVDVGMTKLRSDEGVALDVAILKATIQDEVVPKEKHVVTLKVGCAASAPRQQVNYVIHGLTKRLEDKQDWLVTLKTLIVFHRLMREVDPSFQEELIKYQERTGAHRMLRLEGFADHTTKDTWDYSAWIRVYSVYLDERLGVFKSMRFDPELEASGSPMNNTDTTRETKLKSCSAADLLDKLPQVQKLLNRLIACVPEGAAQDNPIVLQSCIMVLRELRSTYHVVCEGIINLADKFFEMERADAMRGLDLYKDNIALNEKLNAFFSSINNVPSLRGTVQMPNLQPLPADFLGTMEEYVRDAPKIVDASAPPSTRGMGGTTGGQPPAALRTSTMIRAGGTTSPAMAGTGTGVPPILPGPNQGVLKIGGPINDAPAPAPAPAVEVDLLGDDFSSPKAAQAQAVTSPSTAAPTGNGFEDSAFGAPAAFPPAAGGAPGQHPPPPYGMMPGQGPMGYAPQPTGGYPGAPMGMNPFGAPGVVSPVQQPPPMGPQGYGSPPQPYGAPANPFVGPTGGMPPPYGAPPPGYGPPGMYMPQPTGAPGMPPMYMPQPTGAPPANPFGPAGPVWGSGPPPGAAAWGTSNVVPGTATMKRSADPLNEIGADLFGKNNQPPPPTSLRDMKQHG